MELSVTFIEMFWTFAFVLIFCELGEMVSSEFDAFNGSVEQCKWYSFPIEMQRMVVIFMANAQQPSYIRAFGNISCTRETFKKVNLYVRSGSNLFSHHLVECPVVLRSLTIISLLFSLMLDYQREFLLFYDATRNESINK